MAVQAQTNTFVGGMNMDTDIALLPSHQYRYAENIRLLTNDNGSTAALQNIEGIKKYQTSIPANEVILGTTVINKVAVVVTKEVDKIGNFVRNKIYRVTDFDTNSPEHTVIVQGKLGIESESLSVVGNYETDTNIKVYIADGINPVKVIDVMSNKYNDIDGTSSVIDSNGDIINTGALDTTPSATLSPFKVIDVHSGGNLPSGAIQYCYQLFNVHGSETGTSPLSATVSLTQSSTNEDSKDITGTSPFYSSNKSVQLEATLNTDDFDRCRVISIQYRSATSLPVIQVINEFDIVPGTKTITYIDDGNSILNELTIDEFNALIGYQFIASTLEKQDNRLFAANVTEDTWNPDFDARAYSANSTGRIVISSAAHGTLTGTHGTAFYESVPEEFDCINPSSTTNYNEGDDRYEWSNEMVGTTDSGVVVLGNRRGGTGPNVSYSFVTADVQLSENAATSKVGSSTGTIEVRYPDDVGLNVSPQNYETFFLTNPEGGRSVTMYNGTYGSRQFNFADPVYSSAIRGYMRDEIYRFGIVFYNAKGVASPVKWIADIRIPHSATDNSAYIPYKTDNGKTNNYSLHGRPLGIRFTVNNMPAEAVSYEIVRCERTLADRTVVMLAAMSKVGNYTVSGDNGSIGGSLEIRPHIYLGWYAHNLLNYAVWQNDTFPSASIVDDYAYFISPEISISGDNIENQLGNGLYINGVTLLSSSVQANTTASSWSEVKVFAAAYRRKSVDGDLTADASYPGAARVNTGSAGGVIVYADLHYGSAASKYYLPHSSYMGTKTGIVRIGELIATVSQYKYATNLEYNSVEDLSPYYTNIGEKSFLNLATAIWDRKTSNGDWNFHGPAGPKIIAYIPGIQNSFELATMYDTSISNTSNTYKVGSGYPTVSAATGIVIVNFKKNIAPYGGSSFVARQSSIYIPTATHSSTDGTSYVFGGDTYITVLDYPICMTYQYKDATAREDEKFFHVAYIPFETSINLALTNGIEAHRTYASDNYVNNMLQLEPVQMGNYHVQTQPYYSYNDTYSTQPGSKKFVPASLYAEDNVRTSNRIVNSEAKTSNEVLDQWTQFKFANYLDVDNQFGDITNLKSFKDRLFFWQDEALGVAAVNERSLINDNNIGTLTLGTGGILTRYDYVTTTNGSSILNDKSITNSDNVLYWYDLDKNEICAYTGGVSQISKEKNVQSYLNSLSPSKKSSTVAFFDKKYNDVWFKFNKKSLLFNEQFGAFTTFYTFNPQHALHFSDKTVCIKDNDYYALNSLDTDDLGSVSKTAKIQLVINQDPAQTKVFDNVSTSGEFNDPNLGISATPKLDTFKNIAKSVTFETESQKAFPMYENVTKQYDIPGSYTLSTTDWQRGLINTITTPVGALYPGYVETDNGARNWYSPILHNNSGNPRTYYIKHLSDINYPNGDGIRIFIWEIDGNTSTFTGNLIGTFIDETIREITCDFKYFVLQMKGNALNTTIGNVFQEDMLRYTEHIVETTKMFSVDYRENNYRFAIGREERDYDSDLPNLSFPGRMRGKHMICNYEFDCNDGKTFKIPYINTTYRHSLI